MFWKVSPALKGSSKVSRRLKIVTSGFRSKTGSDGFWSSGGLRRPFEGEETVPGLPSSENTFWTQLEHSKGGQYPGGTALQPLMKGHPGFCDPHTLSYATA